MSDAAARVAAELGGPAAARWFRAPGRVNLIGDHTDYKKASCCRSRSTGRASSPLDAVSGKGPPLLGREDALGQARVIDPLYRSAAEGRAVEVAGS